GDGYQSLAGFDQAFDGLQSVFNWVQDFEMEIGNAALENRVWHDRRIAFCEEFLKRFAEEEPLVAGNMRRALAEAVFAIGDRPRGDALFDEWLKENPRWGWGWIGWAHVYSFCL